jgi:hypothetical protein
MPVSSNVSKMSPFVNAYRRIASCTGSCFTYYYLLFVITFKAGSQDITYFVALPVVLRCIQLIYSQNKL